MAKKSTASALAEALSRARVLSAEMSSATDELNASLGEVEKAIADLKLGVTTQVLMKDDFPWSAHLSFGKEQQVWRLLYLTGVEGDDGWKTTLLVNASRAVRLDAVDFLAPLVDQLVKTASSEVENIRTKTKAVKDLTVQLRDVDGVLS